MDPADPNRPPAAKLREGLNELTGILSRVHCDTETPEGRTLKTLMGASLDVLAKMRDTINRRDGDGE